MARKSQRFRRQKRIERMKAREQETKLTKTIEDNSVILERMKNMSSIIDQVCETITQQTEDSVLPVIEANVEPPSHTEESSVEMRIQPFNEPSLLAPQATPNFKKMTKKTLITYAKDNNVAIKPSMTKSQLIKAIQETI